MKKILLGLFLCISFLVNAGGQKLSDGTYVMWPNDTGVIQYNSYRVQISLSGRTNQNVWGTVYLNGAYGNASKSFMIKAGELSTNVDFEGLKNDTRYRIEVKVNNR